MKIRPLHDRVIVKRLERRAQDRLGHRHPRRRSRKTRSRPDLVSVGPGKRDENGKHVTLDVKAGDRVLFSKYAGQTVKVDGEELLVMREEDIMGIVEA